MRVQTKVVEGEAMEGDWGWKINIPGLLTQYFSQECFEKLFAPSPTPCYRVMQGLGHVNGKSLWVEMGGAIDEKQGRTLMKEYKQCTPDQTFTLWWLLPGG